MNSVFITGVSSGIGNALAREYLDRGSRVFGVSRRTPENLTASENFRFENLDLTDHARTGPVLARLLDGLGHLDLAVLNAGIFGRLGDLAEADLGLLQEVMEINVWANKTVIDGLFAGQRKIDQLIAITTGASINGNRGWSGYAISKAALNMLTKLYAKERPETHFCALAPGVVDTVMVDNLLAHPSDPRYPSVEAVRAKRGTPEMPLPGDAAKMLITAIERLPQSVESGSYADIRKLSDNAG